MGSYFGVCAVTQRPIRCFDEVYCLFLKNTKSNEIEIKPSYVGQDWKISALPVKSTYDDSGFIDEIIPEYQKNFDFIFKGNDTETVYKNISDRKNEQYGQIAYILVHSDVVKFAEKYPLYDKEKALLAWEYFKNRCKLAISPLDELMMEFNNFGEQFLKTVEYAKEFNNQDFVYTMIGSLVNAIGSRNGANIDNEQIKTATFEEVYELGIILHLMYGTRKEVRPQVGFGSQDFNNNQEYNIIVDVLNQSIIDKKRPLNGLENED